MSRFEGWTSDPDVVLAAFRLDRQYEWLVPEASAHRTTTGVRLRIPDAGMVADADPSSDGSWWVRAYRVVSVRRAGSHPVDAGLFDLAVAVWGLDAREPDWCVVVPPRPSAEPAVGSGPLDGLGCRVDDGYAGRRVAQSLLDALEGEVHQDWFDTYRPALGDQREQAEWQ